MNKRIFIFSIAILGLTLAGAGCFTTTVSTDTADNAAVNEIAAVLRIDNGEGSVLTYDGTIQENTTALAFLKNMAEEKQFTVETKEYEGLGELVDGINGKKGTNTEFWLFSVNDVPATVGAGAYTVAENDIVEFKWTKAE